VGFASVRSVRTERRAARRAAVRQGPITTSASCRTAASDDERQPRAPGRVDPLDQRGPLRVVGQALRRVLRPWRARSRRRSGRRRRSCQSPAARVAAIIWESVTLTSTGLAALAAGPCFHGVFRRTGLVMLMSVIPVPQYGRSAEFLRLGRRDQHRPVKLRAFRSLRLVLAAPHRALRMSRPDCRGAFPAPSPEWRAVSPSMNFSSESDRPPTLATRRKTPQFPGSRSSTTCVRRDSSLNMPMSAFGSDTTYMH